MWPERSAASPSRKASRSNVGDVLFEIDPVPYRLAVRQAESKLALAQTELANLKANLASVQQLIEIARQNVQLKQNDVDRKAALLNSRSGSAADSDNSLGALAEAKTSLEQLLQQEAQYRNQLLGNPTLPQDEYPAYMQAAAALEQAKRDLYHTVLRAPIAGIATQVDAIQLGRYVNAGTPVFAVMDNKHLWVDANPKETDITYLQIGQKATIHVDTFSAPCLPRHCRRGEPWHRRAIRDPAAAERHRQLGQGRAACSRYASRSIQTRMSPSCAPA